MEQKTWIIQMCTQRWIGTDLQYSDFDSILRTREEMVERLQAIDESRPEEFRGHNVGACACPQHATLRMEIEIGCKWCAQMRSGCTSVHLHEELNLHTLFFPDCTFTHVPCSATSTPKGK